MATHTWSASSPGTASTAGNWTPSGPPGAGDIAVFDGSSPHQCTWDVASVGEIHHQGQTVIVFAGTNVALQGLRMDTNAQISVTSATTLNFSGTAPYKSNSCYILIGATSSPFVNTTSRSNLTLSIAATGTIFFDCGEYPKVSLASGRFTPEHVAPSVTNATDVKMLQLAVASGVNFSPASNPSTESRNKNWIIEGDSQSQFTCSASTFDGGYGNWTFQATSSGFLLPVSGNSVAFSGEFKFQKMTIGNLNGVGSWASIGPATRLVLNDLTVEAGVSLKADDNVGSAILLVNRPTINGTWGFHPIADGYYVYPKYGDVTGFRSGGTGLTTLGTANQVLAVNAGANAIEWQTVSGGGGITALTGNVTASGSGSVAATIADEAVTYAKMQHVSATSRVLGRITSGAGDVEELTAANIRTILGVADGSLSENNFTNADHTKLDGISANADVALPVANNNTVLINTNVNNIAAITVKASKCRVYLSGNQSYTSGSTKITYDSVLYNVGSDFSTTNNEYTAPRDGYYHVSCSYYFTSAPTWAMSLIYIDTGSGYSSYVLRRPSSNGQDNMISSVIKLDAGDKIAHFANASGSGTIGAALDSLTYFTVTELI